MKTISPPTLEQLRKTATIGDIIEVTLKEGVEYDNGLLDDVPTISYSGYDVGENMGNTPGKKIIGYLFEIKEHDNPEYNKVLISANQPPYKPNSGWVASPWYVREGAVHSIRKLE